MAYQIVTWVDVSCREWDRMARLWAIMVRAHMPAHRVLMHLRGASEATNVLLRKLDVETRTAHRLNVVPCAVSDARYSKLFALCQITEPFVFVDCDAYVLGSLDPLWHGARNRISASLHHDTDYVRRMGNRPNSGVLVVQDPLVLDRDMLARMGRREGWSFDRDDQGLLVASLPELHRHVFSTVYNARGKYCRVVASDEPGDIRASCMLSSVPDGRPPGHEVVICHFYGRGSKPWDLLDPVYLGRMADRGHRVL